MADSIMDATYQYYAPGTDKLTQIWNQANNFTSTYTYDANGNMTSDSQSGMSPMTYDIDNLPVSATVNGTQVQYSYDANGSRIEKSAGGTNTYYAVGAGGNTEAVTVVQGMTVNTTYNILAGNDNIGQVEIANGTYTHYYYLKGHFPLICINIDCGMAPRVLIGSIRVTMDSAGDVAGYNDYYPFGETMPDRSEITAGPDTRYQFTSEELDPTTSLYYRVYPTRRVRRTRRSLATEGRSARYYAKHPSDSPWAVKIPSGAAAAG